MRVLVLSRSMGEGHNAAANALGEVFRSRGHDCDVLDALRVGGGADPAAGADSAGDHLPAAVGRHRPMSDIASQLYGWAAFKAPALFGAVYTMGKLYARTPIPSPVRRHNAKYVDATLAFITRQGYDVVVATHVFPQETMTLIRQHHPSRVRYYGVLTDYACTPFFAEGRLDGYFVPHPDMMAECAKAGLPPGITYPLGLPVSPRFSEVLDQGQARAALGLPQRTPLFMLMSGGVGSLYTVDICHRLLADGGENIHLAVLTGRRQDLFATLGTQYRDDPRVTVVPFTDRVPQYMAAADIMLSKPGAVSSTEAAVAGVPLVHTAAIPGQEQANAHFFEHRGMSVYAQKVGPATRVAQWLLDDEARRTRMRACQAATMVPHAAQSVVAKIEELS